MQPRELPTPGPPPERADARRNRLRILEAAAELIGERGFDARHDRRHRGARRRRQGHRLPPLRQPRGPGRRPARRARAPAPGQAAERSPTPGPGRTCRRAPDRLPRRPGRLHRRERRPADRQRPRRARRPLPDGRVRGMAPPRGLAARGAGRRPPGGRARRHAAGARGRRPDPPPPQGAGRPAPQIKRELELVARGLVSQLPCAG